MKKTIAALALAATISLAAPVAAFAEEPGGYPPPPPVAATLAGSTATGECDGDVPWISYSVVLIDPDNQATDRTAELVLSKGSRSVTIPLGELEGNTLSGRVLWPGAGVDDQGNAIAWPGWEFKDGKWVETSGNYAWTRGAITAKLVVNPELQVPLSYPAATPECASGPLLSADAPTGSAAAVLPATGLGASLAPFAIIGGLAAIAGVVLLVLRRRTAQR